MDAEKAKARVLATQTEILELQIELNAWANDLIDPDEAAEVKAILERIEQKLKA